MKSIVMKLKRILGAAGLVAAVVALAAPAAPAQTFPNSPLELTVPWTAGSAPDSVARALAEGMSKHLGQQVIVVNRPGAGGAIGYKYVQSRKADGYTMVLSSNSISTAYYAGMMPFTYAAFQHVGSVSIELPVFGVQASSPLNNLKDVIAYAKQNPGKLRVGHSGIGSHMHLTLEAFCKGQGVEVTQVPFPTSNPVTSLLGGHIDAQVTLPASLSQHVKAGTIKVLGILGSMREPAFPGVPTATEQGYKFESDLWRGIAVRNGTAPEVVAVLEEALRKTVTSPEFKQYGDRIGFLPAYQPGEPLLKKIVAEDTEIAKMMPKPAPQAK